MEENENNNSIFQDDSEDFSEEGNQNEQEISKWEELSANDAVVKKYIIYISKTHAPRFDNMTTDERSDFINDAIQKKIDADDSERQKAKKRKLALHLILTAIVFVLFTPFALLIANKAIMLTFDNYKYSQENFEKLYKQRFEKDKAYIRSLEYNRLHQNKK